MGDYTIQRGDCLWNIAKRQYGDQLKSNSDIQKAVNKLAEANNIKNPNLIYAGNTIIIPDSTSIFDIKTDESGLLDTSNIEDEPTGTVLDKNLYENFSEWNQKASEDFYNVGLNPDTEAHKAQFDEIEGRVFDFNKPDSKNPREDGVLELAESQMKQYDRSQDGYINLDEYVRGNIDEANAYYSDYELDLDDETYQTFKNSFEFFDFNHDNKLETSELKAYYNLVDSSDGEQDGKFTYNQYMHWGRISSTIGEERDYYKNMLDELFKTSYPKQA